MVSLQAAFDLLVDLDTDQRSEQLDSLPLSPADRAALADLLAADAGQPCLVDLPVSSAIEALRAVERRPQFYIGTTVGDFRIVALLGEGGSALVFRAERAAGDRVQTVALKVLRHGLYSDSAERRFRREHAILAQLTHPHIARLVEGGVSAGGLPYLAMELVEGEPITEAAAARGLTLADRLRLCVQLCRAVATPHAALVIHRDLKPSNILLDKHGALKVLDFGIARLLTGDAEHERTRTLSLTPEYAAPELFRRGPQTVAVDVYALGVVLCELLTGQRGGALPSSLVAATDVDLPAGLPARAALAKQLRGDLDAIVQTATAEDPAQRYRSVEALAADLDHVLAGRPVAVRPASALQRAWKFVARHRAAVATTLAVVAAVLASLAVALWQAGLARREAVRANSVRDFVLQVFESARASLPRDQRPTPEFLVAQAAERLEAATDLDAVTRLDLDRTLGSVWLSLGSYGAADAAFERARLRAAALGRDDLLLELQVLQAEGWQRLGRNEEAARALVHVLPRLGRGPAPLRLQALAALAEAEVALGRLDSALAREREAARLATSLHGADSIAAVAAELEVGDTLAVIGRHAESLAQLEPQLARWRQLGAPTDARYVQALTNLAVARDVLGRPEDSEAALREVLELKRRIYPGPHESIARTLRSIASLRLRKRDYPGAESLLQEALQTQREALGPDHVEVAKTLDTIGVMHAAQGHEAQAVSAYQEALAICSRAPLGDDVCPRAHANLGRTWHRMGRLDDAERVLRQALAGRQELYGAGHANVAISMTRLAELLADRGQTAEALTMASTAVAQLRTLGQGSSREAALAQSAWARALERDGQHAHALRQIEHALDLWLSVAPAERDRRIPMLALQGRILQRLGRTDRVADVLREVRTLDVPPEQLWPATRRELEALQ